MLTYTGTKGTQSRFAVCAQSHGARKPLGDRSRGQRGRFHLRHLGREFHLQLAASAPAEALVARNHDQRHLHVSQNRSTMPARLAAARPSWCRIRTIWPPSTASLLSISAIRRESITSTKLPFGQGHRFAQKGLTGALFGNWRFSGNIGAQTGTPYTAEVVGTSAANSGSGGVFATRADQICNPNVRRDRRTAGFLQYRLLRRASGRTIGQCRAQHHQRPGHVYLERANRKNFSVRQRPPASRWIFAGRSPI